MGITVSPDDGIYRRVFWPGRADYSGGRRSVSRWRPAGGNAAVFQWRPVGRSTTLTGKYSATVAVPERQRTRWPIIVYDHSRSRQRTTLSGILCATTGAADLFRKLPLRYAG